jgi:hypothetical protein
LMETEDPSLFQLWAERWKDLVNIEVIELGEKPRESKTANRVAREDCPPGSYSRPGACERFSPCFASRRFGSLQCCSFLSYPLSASLLHDDSTFSGRHAGIGNAFNVGLIWNRTEFLKNAYLW